MNNLNWIDHGWMDGRGNYDQPGYGSCQMQNNAGVCVSVLGVITNCSQILKNLFYLQTICYLI